MTQQFVIIHYHINIKGQQSKFLKVNIGLR